MNSEYSQANEILKNYINPKHIILMHIQYDENKKYIDAIKEAEKVFPDVMVFEKLMGTKENMFD